MSWMTTLQTFRPIADARPRVCGSADVPAHSGRRCRYIRHPSPKLKPASQSYLHRDSQAAIVGVIIGLATVLILTKIWLIRLLG